MYNTMMILYGDDNEVQPRNDIHFSGKNITITDRNWP